MVIEGVDRTIKQLNSTIIKGKANDVEFALSLPTQVIADTKNTNSDYVTCSLPELQFNFLKCVRQGKNVVITATFKNNSNKEYSVCSGNKMLRYMIMKANLMSLTEMLVSWARIAGFLIMV